MKANRCMLLFIFVLINSFALQAEEMDRNLEGGFGSIRPMDVYGYCKILASPRFAGRLTGHEGYTAAARWAAGKFEEWGLEPIGAEEGYLQPFPSPYTLVDEAGMKLLLYKNNGGGDENRLEEVELEAGEDFMPAVFTGTGGGTAGLVFAGWGISAPDLGYDDYAGIDVRGKFVICFRGTPDREDKRYESHDRHRRRMKTAKAKGALGVFYIYSDPIANPNGDWIEGFTPGNITEKTADMILDEKGMSSSDLKEDLAKYKRPLSFPLSSKVSYRVVSRHFPEGVGYNVAGYVEGSDRGLAKECLVIGGHLDHCGLHLGMLFAGAQDNASGSAVVMEIAEAFSKVLRKPRRPVVFVLFGGEEMGLLGSNYFADHLPARFERIDAMFNFDMTGEGEGTSCGYTPDPPELKRALDNSDRYVNTIRRTWEIEEVGVRSSDYAPFFLKGAGCVAFFANGPHLHYHGPGDTIYRINPDMLADAARIGFLSAFEWADR